MSEVESRNLKLAHFEVNQWNTEAVAGVANRHNRIGETSDKGTDDEKAGKSMANITPKSLGSEWQHIGCCSEVPCNKCGGGVDVYRSFKGPLPQLPNSWALWCLSCNAEFTLEDFSPEEQGILATWATVGGSLQDFLETAGLRENMTDEQACAVRLASPINEIDQPVKELAIQALAGTGKTTTLLKIAQRKEHTQETGQYISFNKAIVDEFKDKIKELDLKQIKANTMHSLAYAKVGKRFHERLGERTRWRNSDYSEFLGCTAWEFKEKSDTYRYGPAQIAELAKLTVEEFIKSKAEAILPEHVLLHVSRKVVTEINREALVNFVLPFAEKLWEDLVNPLGDAPFNPNVYLKLWQLEKPVIDADYILFDEAQDADDVMIDIINHQRALGKQIIVCGDAFQQVYEWRGANNALQKMNIAHRINLTLSFRFGNEIAAEANKILQRINELEDIYPPFRVCGVKSIDSIVGPADSPDVILCRTNGGAITNLMSLYDTHQKVALVADRDYLLKIFRGLKVLKDGERSRHPELRDFKSWDDLVDYVEENKRSAGELGTFVRLAKRESPGRLLYAISQTVETEANADVVISTVHKAKGREWDTVKIYRDFPHVDDITEQNLEELRILYVALTRAKRHLDIEEWSEVAPSNNDEPKDCFFGPVPRLVAGKQSAVQKEADDDLPDSDEVKIDRPE